MLSSGALHQRDADVLAGGDAVRADGDVERGGAVGGVDLRDRFRSAAAFGDAEDGRARPRFETEIGRTRAEDEQRDLAWTGGHVGGGSGRKCSAAVFER